MSGYEKVKAWRKANPDKRAAEARRYRAKHPDKVAAVKARYRAKNLESIRAADAERQRERRKDVEAQRLRYERWRAKKEANLTVVAGRPRPDRCEVCGEFHLRIVFDHCHAKGHFRGWLCDRCNKMLGLVRDSPELLRKLAGYLEANDGAALDKETELAARFRVRLAWIKEVSGLRSGARRECEGSGYAAGEGWQSQPELCGQDQGQGQSHSGEMIHVYPLFGRAHKCSPNCWCEPEPDAVEPDVLIHRPDKLACLYSC